MSDFHPPKTSVDICIVHDDLGLLLLCAKSHMLSISGGRTKQHVVIGFGELAAVD